MNKRNNSDEQELQGELLEILKTIAFSEKVVICDDIATELNINKPKAEYFLDTLETLGFITSRIPSTKSPKIYSMTKEGRSYLFDRKLL